MYICPNKTILMENIETKFAEFDKKIDKLVEANVKITESLEIIATSLQEVNEKVDKLNGESKEGFKTVDNRLEEVLVALRKINNLTGYEGQDENETLLKKIK